MNSEFIAGYVRDLEETEKEYVQLLDLLLDGSDPDKKPDVEEEARYFQRKYLERKERRNVLLLSRNEDPEPDIPREPGPVGFRCRGDAINEDEVKWK